MRDGFVGVAAVLSTAALLGTAPGSPWLLWNTTSSAPLGLYLILPPRNLQAGDCLAVRPPAAIAVWLDRSGFLPSGALLLKRLAAAPGAEVCRRADVITIDGRAAARARVRDRRGRPLPAWSGCVRLSSRDLFLLNPDPDSLDGRYLGPTGLDEVVGRARPLWTVPQP